MPFVVRTGNLVIESWPPADPLAAFSEMTMRRAWGSGSWARSGVAGRLPDPWQRASARQRHDTDYDTGHDDTGHDDTDHDDTGPEEANHRSRSIRGV